MLSTGVAWTTGWLEDVEAACTEGLWPGTLGSALPALQSLARCSSEPQFKHFLNRSALDNSFMECWLLHLDPNLHPLGERKYLHVLPFPPPLPPPLAPLPFPALSPEASAAFNARLLDPPFWQPVLQPKSQTQPTNVCGRI